MGSAEKQKAPQQYQFPAAHPMELPEELSLATDIQTRITGLALNLDARLQLLVAAAVPHPMRSTDVMTEARASLRVAVIRQVIERPTDFAGFADRVCSALQAGCTAVAEAAVAKDKVRDSALECFGTLGGEANAFINELATLNVLANRFVEANMGLVRKIAKTVKTGFLAEEDLWQEGSLALRAAAMHYQPGSDAKFGTFAYTAVQNRLTDVSRSSGPVTDHAARKLEEFAYGKESLRLLLGREPSDAEVFAELGWSDEVGERVRGALAVIHASSLSCAPGTTRPPTPVSPCCSPADAAIHAEELRRLASSQSQLSHDEAKVINKRYFLGMSLREIAKQDGKSDQAVRKLHRSAVAKMTRSVSGEERPSANGA